VTLDDLHRLGSVDLALVGFLRAAVRARKNIVVTGGVNAGKTTLAARAGERGPGRGQARRRREGVRART
jgi:Flp pilus assembly CpaF family ATPase